MSAPMDMQMIVLRILHIVTGVYWAGAIFVFVTFIANAVRDAGPAGGQVMGALIRRRYFDFMPGIALVTVLSGFWLYYRTSNHFDPLWMGSRLGMTIGVGAVAGLVALAIGVFVARPSTLAAAATMGKAVALPDGPEKAATIATADRLRARGIAALRATALFLLLAVLSMAVARYL